MATYTTIQGQSVVNITSDPSPAVEGQVWYNSTSNVWKILANGIIKTLTVS